MIFPDKFPAHCNNPAEKRVFEALSKLDPHNFDVFWNRSFACKDRHSREDQQYEIDFLVFDLREECLNHIYIIEVKGGLLEYRGGENAWYQSGRKMETGPDTQVMGYATNIIERYAELIKHKVPVTWLLWFPDGILEEEFLPPQLDQWRVLDQKDLKDPLLALEDAQEAQEAQFHNFKGMSPDDYENSIKNRLTRNCAMKASLSSLIREMDDSIEQADQLQEMYLGGLAEKQRLAVDGCAGSGKTVLAISIAEKLQERGQRVLLLCFNKYLAAILEDSVSSEITTANIHHFMRCSLDEKEPGWFDKQQEKDNEFFNKKLPEKLREVLKLQPPKEEEKYDAVLVDEAQDMEVGWLNLFLKFLRPQGKYFLFYDSRQNIFKRNFTLPLGQNWESFPLNFNYRNSIEINQFINETIGTDFRSGPMVPKGEKVRRRTYDAANPAAALFRSLAEVHRVGGVPLEQIKIITDGSVNRWPLATYSSPGTYTYELLDAETTQQADRVYFSSIHKFKGCEAEVVILLLRDRIENVENKNTLYTQLSRARSLLYVMEPAE